jgi:DNA-binding CsgD family transcriptional regulator
MTGPEQQIWHARLDQERDNLRVAARWATERGDVESALRLGAALVRFWRYSGSAADARERFEDILTLANTAPPLPATARAFEAAGELATVVGDLPAAESLFGQSLAIARQLDDRAVMAGALRRLAQVAGFQGRYAEARVLGQESLAIVEQSGDLVRTANTLIGLGMLSYFDGDYADAQALFERSAETSREIGDHVMASEAEFCRALILHVTGELDAAWQTYQECLALNREIGYRVGEGSCLNNLGSIATLRGDVQEARLLLTDSLVASRDGGDLRRLGFTLSAVGALAATEGDSERALRLDAAGLAALAGLGATLAPPMRTLYDEQLVPAQAALGEAGAAARAGGRALTLEQAVNEALAWLAAPSTPTPTATVPRTTPADAVLRQASGARSAPGNVRAAPDALPRREREVAMLLARGLSNRQIAEALVVSERTAGNYVQRVMNRLGLENRVQVAAWAIEHRLAEQPAEAIPEP